MTLLERRAINAERRRRHIPNAETREAIRQAKAGENLVTLDMSSLEAFRASILAD